MEVERVQLVEVPTSGKEREGDTTVERTEIYHLLKNRWAAADEQFSEERARKESFQAEHKVLNLAWNRLVAARGRRPRADSAMWAVTVHKTLHDLRSVLP